MEQIGGLLPIPTSNINKIKMNYPVGTNDFEEIFEKKFNFEEYKNTPQYYRQGLIDKSNPFRKGAEDLTDNEFIVVKKLFTNGLLFNEEKTKLETNHAMWKNTQKYINEIVSNVKFESPEKEKHEITPMFVKASENFIKENIN